MNGQQQKKRDIFEQYKLLNNMRKFGQNLKNMRNPIDAFNNTSNAYNNIKGSSYNAIQPTNTPTLSSDLGTTPNITNTFSSTQSVAPTLDNVSALSGGTSTLGTNTLTPMASGIASEAGGAGGTQLASLGNIGANIATTAGGEALAGAGTGAASALGGASAAGAAGGAGATAGGLGAGMAGAGAALGALAPVGAGLAAAYMIYNMIASAKEKNNQKAMQEAEKGSAQSQQEAEKTALESMQQLQQGANQNRQELKNEVSEDMNNDGLKGDLYNQVTNPSLRQMALNNQTNPQPVEQVQVPASGAADVADTVDNVNNGLSITNDIMGLFNGGDTGSIPISTKTPVPEAVDTVEPPVTDNNGLLTEQIAGVGRGNEMLSDTPDTTYNQMTPPYIDQYDGMSNTDLAMSANDINDEAIDHIDPNAQLKGNLMQNVRNGMQNFMAGYKDNAENGFLEGDIANGRKGDKTFGQRLGEFAGTASRVLQNPYVQGGIAGALYGKDRGNALYGLGKGWEWAQNRAKNNAYVDALRKVGVNVPNGVLGGISGTDAAAIANIDMLPAKKDYYRGRAAQGLASAGLKADGTPYTAKDVKDMRSLASGDDVDDDMVINPYFKGEQTRYNKGQDVEVSKNNVTASENYVKNGANKVKAAQLGYDTAVQYGKNKNIPTRQDVYHHSDKNNGSPSSQNNSNPQKPAPINTSSNNVKTQGIVDKLIDRAKKNKKTSYATPSGVKYRIV